MSVQINPRKLLLSKWTAVQPQAKEKHFIVTGLIDPGEPGLPVTEVEVEAVYSRRKFIIPWKTLTDITLWRQGWL